MEQDSKWFEHSALSDPDIKIVGKVMKPSYVKPPPREIHTKGKRTLDYDKNKREAEFQKAINEIEKAKRENRMKDFYDLVKRVTAIKKNARILKGVIREDGVIYDQERVEYLVSEYYGQLYKSDVTVEPMEMDFSTPAESSNKERSESLRGGSET